MKPEERDLLGKKDAQPKKPYATPKLTVHGDVEKITEDLAAGAPDGLMGGSEPGMEVP